MFVNANQFPQNWEAIRLLQTKLQNANASLLFLPTLRHYYCPRLLLKVLGAGIGFAFWPSIPHVQSIDFSSLPPQVGMNDLTVVNLHLALPPSAGENTGKNHDSHKLAACAQSLQETLKGRAGVFPASCHVHTVQFKGIFKRVNFVSVSISEISLSASQLSLPIFVWCTAWQMCFFLTHCLTVFPN